MEYTPAFMEAMERVAAVQNYWLQDAQLEDFPIGEFTREEYAQEQARQEFKTQMLALGSMERLHNLYRIRDKESGKFVFFRPNREQERFLRERKGRDLILKSRQIGATTLSCIYAYDRALWDGWDTGIMAHVQDNVKLIFRIVKNANDYFVKDWGHLYAPVEESNNTTRLSWLDLKSSITVAYTCQGLTLQFLHVSEAAFVDGNRLTFSIQAVPETGEVVLESTPNGCGGFFYKAYQDWKEKGLGAPYRGHFFPWPEHYPEDPSRWENQVEDGYWSEEELELLENYHLTVPHLLWRRWKIFESCEGSEETFRTQYPIDDISCFLAGMNSVYPESTLKYQSKFVCEPAFVGSLRSEDRKINFYNDKKGLLQIWTLPKPEYTYVVGVDCSEGIGQDQSIAFVMCQQTGEQVAELAGQMDPDLFANELYKLGVFYNRAHMAPEINNHGHLVVNVLKNKGYGSLYRRKEMDSISSKVVTKIGFLTSATTKVPLTDNLGVYLREGKLKIKSQAVLKELSTYVQAASKQGRTLQRMARADCKDDRVIAAALACEMDRVRPFVQDAAVAYNPIDNKDGAMTDPYSGHTIF